MTNKNIQNINFMWLDNKTFYNMVIALIPFRQFYLMISRGNFNLTFDATKKPQNNKKKIKSNCQHP